MRTFKRETLAQLNTDYDIPVATASWTYPINRNQNYHGFHKSNPCEESFMSIAKVVPLLNLSQYQAHPHFLKSTEERWQDYLENLPQISNGKFNIEYVALIKKVRVQLHNFLAHKIMPPDVVEGEDGGLQLVWEKNHYYLSVDVISDKNIEWFFKNEKTGDFWGAEGIALSDFPPEELTKQLAVWK